MNSIEDLQGFLIDSVGNENSKVRTLVESYNNPHDIVAMLLLLGYSQGKDTKLLSELFTVSDEHYNDEKYIQTVSNLINDIFR